MKDTGWNIDSLPCLDRASLFTQAHLAAAFHNEIDLFLLLIVPGHLAAVRFQSDIAQGKIRRLDGTHASYQILRAPPRRERAAGYLRQIGNNHEARIARPRSIIGK